MSSSFFINTLDRHVGVLRLQAFGKQRHDDGERAVVVRLDAHGCGRLATNGACLRKQLLVCRNNLARITQEHPSSRRRCDGRRAFKELAANLLLDLRDLAAHRLLGHIALARRLGYARVENDLEKEFDVVDVQLTPLFPSHYLLLAAKQTPATASYRSILPCKAHHKCRLTRTGAVQKRTAPRTTTYQVGDRRCRITSMTRSLPPLSCQQSNHRQWPGSYRCGTSSHRDSQPNQPHRPLRTSRRYWNHPRAEHGSRHRP